MAKKTSTTPPPADPGERISKTLAEVRATRIREARAREPQPTYQQIALEVGCCEKTVYNVLARADDG